MSEGYFQRQDLRHYVSTDVETGYGVATPQERFEDEAGREFMLAQVPVQETIKRTPYNLCGGEFFTETTDEQRDANAPINFFATPDATGWFEKYNFGGGGGYLPTGSADPWTHQNRPVQAPDYVLDSFSLVEGYKGGTEFWRYRGGLISSSRVYASIDGDKRVRIEAAAEFAGEREALVDFDPPECVGEEVYRIVDATVTIGLFEGPTTFSGLTVRSFDWRQNNALETLDEVARTGQYVRARDRGDRSDNFRLGLSILGKKGDNVDLAFTNGSFVYVTIAIPNKTANRVWTRRMLKGKIISKTEGWSTSVNKSTHDIEMLGMRDRTNDTTIAQSPFYSTIQTGTETYSSVAP